MTDQHPRILIGPQESMPEFLARLAATSGGRVSVVIPVSSSLMLTASEFRALKAAADQRQIRLTVETDDRLRKQLAAMFGLQVIDPLPESMVEPVRPAADAIPWPTPPTPIASQPPAPVTSPPPASPPPTIESQPAPPVRPSSPPHAAADPTVASEGAQPEPDIEVSTEEIDSSPPPVRSTKASLTPSRTAESFAKATAAIELDPEDTPPPSAGFPWKWLVVGLAGLVTVMLAGLIAAFLFQRATVNVTMTRQPIASEMQFAVVSEGEAAPASAAFQLPGESVSFDVPFTATILVTGAIRDQISPATGTVELRNPTDQPITVPAGTQFSNFERTTFAFTADVLVPAANGSQPGQTHGPISSVSGGEAANLPAGTLSGKLDLGVYYMNRDAALTGGTDQSTPAVAQADIDTLIAQADAQLPQLAAGYTLPDGRGIVPNSVRPGPITYSADKRPGDAGTDVTITATMNATGTAYALDTAIANAQPSLTDTLRASVPPGNVLDESTIVIAPTGADAGPGLVTLRATGDIRPVWSAEQEDAVADQIAGKDVAEAESYLVTLPGVASAEIESSPGFLPERIPGRSGRISIEQR